MAASEQDYDWNDNTAVGIDLGTTFSCVSVYREGRITVVPDEDGHKLIPSVVAFVSERGVIQRLVGRDATENKNVDASHIVTEVKRLIGRKFNDPAIQTNIKRWPFKVTASRDGNAQVEICLDGQPKLHLSPEEISSSILVKLKKMAERHLGNGQEVKHAVITVPAHFNNSQREATKKAAELANISVRRIINEPCAGALAYGYRTKVAEKRKILVIDIGGGTSDVALIEVVGENFTVFAFEGDNNLGGEDFDTNLVHYCMESIRKKIGSHAQVEKKTMLRLRNKCEHTKRKLSENPDNPNWQYVLELEDVVRGIDITLPISRTNFEHINQKLFIKTIGLVPSCLRKATMSIADVDDIVTVGGSMRIPKLRQMLQTHFRGKSLYGYINPDEAISVGASIMAAQIIGNYCGHVMLSDITPFSLGIHTHNENCNVDEGKMSVIIPISTTIPCQETRRYTTWFDFQTVASIDVYQGEKEFVRDNMLLGSFTIGNLTPALAEETKLDVTFHVNRNGILEVTAKEVATENEVKKNLDSLLPHLNMLSITREK